MSGGGVAGPDTVTLPPPPLGGYGGQAAKWELTLQSTLCSGDGIRPGATA